VRLVRLAVERPVGVLMLLVSILLLGGIALTRLPLAFLPEVDVPIIAIEIPYPNSSPQQVQEEIVEPVEEALATLSGIEKVRATSEADGATLVLEFEWGQELDVVRMQVAEKLDLVKAKLPARARTVFVHSFNTADIPVVEARIAAEGVDLSESYPLLERRILDPLRRVPGVARVEINGVEPRQVFVDLVHARIKEHRVEVGDLVERLQAASAQEVLGRVDDGGRRFAVRGLGAFESLEELEAMPIGVGDLQLRDIAVVSYEEPPIQFGRHLGREYAVGLSVFKESTANTVSVVEEVMRVIDNDIKNDPALEGVQLFVWEDQAEHIRAGIDGLRMSGIVGGLMAVVCLYLFLRRFGATLIVALSIPFSVIAACGALYFMGGTLNLLSMMGLMLGVGMLVDNAIVVLESIDRTRRSEPDPRKAALEGARAVVLAVVAATATTLIVFLPLVVGGSTELTTWLREVGITISLALSCSLLSSLTLIPMLAARMKRAPKEADATPGWMENAYASLLAAILRRRKLSAALLLVVLAVGAVPMMVGWLPMEPFSAQVNRRLGLNYDFKDFRYKSQAEDAVDVVEEHLYAHAEEFGVDEVYSYYAENEAGTVILLQREDMDDDEIKELRAQIRDSLPPIPGVEVRFDQDAESGGDSTYFSVQLYGRDGETLRELSERAAAVLEGIEGMRDVSTSLEHGRDEIQVEVDRERALRRGITPQDAAEAFAFTLGGQPLPRFRDGEREVDTTLALRIEDRASLEDLRGIAFPVEKGQPVQLGDIASFETVQRPRQLVRENRQGNAWVRATFEGEDWPGTREIVEQKMNELDKPMGYTWSWDARTLESDTQAREMSINFLLALALVYLVLASLFESVTQPIAIVVSIVFAVPGAAWLLVATDTPMNLMAQIGLLILMGVVVNNGVVLLDRVNQLRAEGKSHDEAFIEAGRDRLRPILMTMSTTVLGLIPLALGGSAVGGLFYFPLARTVIGGLLSAAVLTLLALPLLTMSIEWMAGTAKRAWSHRG
jgi:HAE1 family hydrophobic/amphiphilic exporter-1